MHTIATTSSTYKIRTKKQVQKNKYFKKNIFSRWLHTKLDSCVYSLTCSTCICFQQQLLTLQIFVAFLFVSFPFCFILSLSYNKEASHSSSFFIVSVFFNLWAVFTLLWPLLLKRLKVINGLVFAPILSN